jgi:DNA-binding transcriptional LysR family regulator
MVEAGLGVSLAPESVVKDGSHRAALLARPLKPALFRHLALVQRRDKPASPALDHVRDAILALGSART